MADIAFVNSVSDENDLAILGSAHLCFMKVLIQIILFSISVL